MKISIIIPTLNEEKLISKILNQLNDKNLRSLADYEIIVSDGGSRDRTVAISKSLADRVIEYNGKVKQNISMGRNIGALQSTGDILVFLNGDVVISDPEKLFKRIINVFANQKFIAMTCKVEVFPDQKKISDVIFQSFYNYYFHLLNIIGVGMGRGECQVIGRNIFNALNGYNEKLAAGEDFEFFKRIRKHGKIYFARDIIVYESPRRYRKYGHLYIFFSWLLNSIFVIFKKRSMSKTWEEIR